MKVSTKNYLLISTGHNSSAIYFGDNGNTVVGYEQERIDSVKSSGVFPMEAIGEIGKNVGYKKLIDCDIFINHWNNRFTGKYSKKFTFSDEEVFKDFCNSKYFSEVFLNDFKNNICLPSSKLSHHDTHCFSSALFFNHFTKVDNHKFEDDEEITFLVMDGFGNREEVISLYSNKYKYIKRGVKPKLRKRIYGYSNSLGLMYQYATSYTGMKENQDEYKFLGYESYIYDIISPKKVELIKEKAYVFAKSFYNRGFRTKTKDPIGEGIDISLDNLKNAKDLFYIIFDSIKELSGIKGNSEKFDYDFKLRSVIGFFIQTVIEKFVSILIRHKKIKNLVLSGGCFYNVKLNNSILKAIPGKLCVMPLAGDQGASIGYLLQECPDADFSKLFTFTFGQRDLSNLIKVDKSFTPIKNDALNVENIAQKLLNNEIVNIIYNGVEFGPRALCHTSTLFLPSQENASINNLMNGRNEVMPTAPVLLSENLDKFFSSEQYEKVIGSDRFMIITYDYTIPFEENYSGIMHAYPSKETEKSYSGRPQVIYSREQNPFMYDLLKKLSEKGVYALTNTSFNVHGQPIVFTPKQIKSNFNYQFESCKELNIKEPSLFFIKD